MNSVYQLTDGARAFRYKHCRKELAQGHRYSRVGPGGTRGCYRAPGRSAGLHFPSPAEAATCPGALTALIVNGIYCDPWLVLIP